MKVKFGEDWSDWTKLDNLRDIPKEPGAYIIATEKKINRIIGKDNDGILSIGETDNLFKRIQMFLSCAEGKRHRGHNAGWRYYKLDLKKEFPIISLYICWKSVSSKKEAHHLEGEELKKYANKHYELPPLNYKYNWSDEKKTAKIAKK